MSVIVSQVESEASERTETAAEAQGLNVTPWSDDEQKLLEQALKTFPSSLGASRLVAKPVFTFSQMISIFFIGGRRSQRRFPDEARSTA